MCPRGHILRRSYVISMMKERQPMQFGVRAVSQRTQIGEIMSSQTTVNTYSTTPIGRGDHVAQSAALTGRFIGYWVSTATIAFIFVSSGLCYAVRLPQVVEGVQNLGVPLHFVVLLGVWKV